MNEAECKIRKARTVLIAIAARLGLSSLLFLVFVCVGMFGFGSSCSADRMSEAASNDGRWLAVAETVNCGATVSYATTVTVVDVKRGPQGKGTVVFTADGNHGAAPASRFGGPDVRLTWRGSSNLVIARHEKARVFQMESHLRDIFISHEILSE